MEDDPDASLYAYLDSTDDDVLLRLSQGCSEIGMVPGKEMDPIQAVQDLKLVYSIYYAPEDPLGFMRLMESDSEDDRGCCGCCDHCCKCHGDDDDGIERSDVPVSVRHPRDEDLDKDFVPSLRHAGDILIKISRESSDD